MLNSQVLIVEDESIVALDLQARLNRMGFKAEVAFSGEEAVAAATEQHPDLILMDIVLPGSLDGIEAAEQIQNRIDVPVVYLTAYSDEKTLERATQTGPYGYLLKPLKERELYPMLEVAMYKHGLEKRLRQSEDRYRDLVENSSEFICTHDLAGNILSVNKTAAKKLGCSQQDGKTNIREILAPESADKFDDYMYEILANGRASGIMLALTNCGETRVLEYNNSLRVEGVDKPIIRGMARDITELRRVQQEREELLSREKAARRQAEEASRLKDEFLSILSHELRTPLTAIRGWIHLLRQGDLGEANAQKAIDVIERNALTQTRIIEDILDTSRIITGKFRLDPMSVYLPTIVLSTIDSLRPAIESKAINLQIDVNPHIGRVFGDSTRLQQIVWNLLSNAAKFTGRNGEIAVRLDTTDDGYARLAISDNGCGIDPEFLPYVFDRFRQADSSATRIHGGLGLGLSIVRHLVELHGGSVSAESEGLGRGATFIVKLPSNGSHQKEIEEPTTIAVASNTPGDKPNSQTPELSIIRGLKILIVEDEEDARDVFSTILSRNGAEVKTTSTNSEALRILQEWQPDILVSELGLPLESGHALIKSVRALDQPYRDIPAVAFTAYTSEEDRILTIESGYHAHISKPVDPAELVAVVAALAKTRNR